MLVILTMQNNGPAQEDKICTCWICRWIEDDNIRVLRSILTHGFVFEDRAVWFRSAMADASENGFGWRVVLWDGTSRKRLKKSKEAEGAAAGAAVTTTDAATTKNTALPVISHIKAMGDAAALGIVAEELSGADWVLQKGQVWLSSKVRAGFAHGDVCRREEGLQRQAYTSLVGGELQRTSQLTR